MVKTEKSLDDEKNPCFEIQILNKKHNPIKGGIRFDVTIDEEKMIIITDSSGLLKMPVPKSKIKLSLTKEESIILLEE